MGYNFWSFDFFLNYLQGIKVSKIEKESNSFFILKYEGKIFIFSKNGHDHM